MSNHSSDGNDEIHRKFKEMFANAGEKLGPTGDFPRGRLSPTDEGGIKFAVGGKDGVVIIDFGKPVVWVGMPPEQARQLAESLVKHADNIESKSER